MIIDDYQNVAKSQADWTLLSYVDVSFRRAPVKEIEDLRGYDILVAMRERTVFDRDLLSALPDLKLLVTSGMRNVAIDLAAAKELGILVCGTKSFKEPPIELTFGLMLCLARRIDCENYNFHQRGPWQSTLGICLSGKTLGLVGLGAIGERVARIAAAFGMEVMAWSQNLTDERAAEVHVERRPTLKDLLSRSDFVSVHTRLSPRTKDLFGTDEFAAMPKHAFLINTSRAEIITRDALLAALRTSSIQGAGLDVHYEEPAPLDDPFRDLANVIATPHLGYVADKNYQVYFSEAVENIRSFVVGKPIRVLNS